MAADKMIRQFIVTAEGGNIEATGFTHVLSTSPYTVAVFARAFRRLKAQGDRYYRQRTQPQWTLDYDRLLGVFVNPRSVLPHRNPPVSPETLDYGLCRTGDWWQEVEVDYVLVPESLEAQLP